MDGAELALPAHKNLNWANGFVCVARPFDLGQSLPLPGFAFGGLGRGQAHQDQSPPAGDLRIHLPHSVGTDPQSPPNILLG